MHRIFVYGSLKQGFGNHRLLNGTTFIGEAITTPNYTMISLGGFPGVFEGGDTSIKGELYEVDNETLRDLDLLEGHPTFYCRTSIDVTLEDGTKAEVETYLLPSPHYMSYSPITSGEWSLNWQ